MRPLLLLSLLSLAACGGGDDGNNSADAAGAGNQQVPMGNAAGPTPKTPVIRNLPVAPGNEATWMEPRPAPGAPTAAPYGNLLDQPVVNGRAAP